MKRSKVILTSFLPSLSPNQERILRYDDDREVQEENGKLLTRKKSPPQSKRRTLRSKLAMLVYGLLVLEDKRKELLRN